MVNVYDYLKCQKKRSEFMVLHNPETSGRDQNLIGIIFQIHSLHLIELIV